MNCATDDGFYTKTQAYNFLKNLLGVSKNVLIRREFFLLFFEEIDELFRIKSSEEMIQSIFTKEGIVETNKVYFQKKQCNACEEANNIFNEVLNKVKKDLLQAA